MNHSASCFLFDFGNVIGFFDHLRACRRLAEMSRIRLDQHGVYEQIFRSGIEAQYDRGELSTDTFLETLRTVLDLGATPEEIGEAWSDIFWPNEAVTQLIPTLHAAAYRLLLASNTNELHCRWFRRQFAETLSYFDRQIVSHELGHRKPAREFYERCLEAAGCPASECVYLDDREDLVGAAASLGIRGIVYHPELDLEEELRKMGVLG